MPIHSHIEVVARIRNNHEIFYDFLSSGSFILRVPVSYICRYYNKPTMFFSIVTFELRVRPFLPGFPDFEVKAES